MQKNLSLLILPLLIGLVYYEALFGKVIYWDDFQIFYTNPFFQKRSWSDFVGIWTTVHQYLYIPIIYSYWFALVEFFGKEDVFIYHLLNLFFHLLNSLLVFEITKIFLQKFSSKAPPGQQFTISLGAALIFALHPFQVESVAWLSAVKELLSTFFGLLSIWSFVKLLDIYAVANKNPKREYLFLSAWIVFFFLSIFSKPGTVYLLPIYVVLAYSWGTLRQNKKLLLPYIVACLVSAVLSYVTIEQQSKNLLLYVPPLGGRVLVSIDTFAFYFKSFLFPYSFMPDYGRTPQLAEAWSLFWHGLNVLILVIIFLFAYFKKVWTLLLSFIIAILPVSGIIPFFYQQTSTVADRYMYFPMLWLILCFAIVISQANFSKLTARAAMAGFFAIVIYLSWISMNMVPHWRDNDSFFAWMERQNPKSFQAINILGDLCAERDNFVCAIQYYEKSLSVAEWQPYPRLKRALAHYNMGNVSLAKEEMLALLARYPTYENARKYLELMQQQK